MERRKNTAADGCFTARDHLRQQEALASLGVVELAEINRQAVRLAEASRLALTRALRARIINRKPRE